MPSLPRAASPVRIDLAEILLLTDRRISEKADVLAWIHDSPDNDESNYPGEGWDENEGED